MEVPPIHSFLPRSGFEREEEEEKEGTREEEDLLLLQALVVVEREGGIMSLLVDGSVPLVLGRRRRTCCAVGAQVREEWCAGHCFSLDRSRLPLQREGQRGSWWRCVIILWWWLAGNPGKRGFCRPCCVLGRLGILSWKRGGVVVAGLEEKRKSPKVHPKLCEGSEDDVLLDFFFLSAGPHWHLGPGLLPCRRHGPGRHRRGYRGSQEDSRTSSKSGVRGGGEASPYPTNLLHWACCPNHLLAIFSL